MAYAIPSEDFLAICLILATGDTGIGTEEVIKRAEVFQKMNNNHIGVSEADFRMAFVRLGLETEFLQFESIRYADEILEFKEIPLKQWIPFMLQFQDIHFNDEGEHWCGKNEVPSKRNQWMREFFKYPWNDSPERILSFLTGTGRGNNTLKLFLESGLKLACY